MSQIFHIEPIIDDFHFRYDTLSYAGGATSVFSKIKVRIILTSGDHKIWEKSFESPEQKRGPWFFMPSHEDVGATVSDALGYALRQIAEDILNDKSINQFVEITKK